MKFKFIVVLFISTLLAVSCSKEESSQVHGEIISFNSLKSGHCWGWTIKIENQIIKADCLPNTEKIGHDIKSPIPVLIELGDCEFQCPTNGYDYYEILSLQLVE